PLYFLDYIGIARLEPQRVETIVKGVADGCRQAGCALVGGETAELPDLYAAGEYDLAGFAVGVVERRRIVDGRAVRPGDAVLGVASSGLHANGYSLARRIVFGVMKLGIGDALPGTGRSVADELLEPTRIYAGAVKALLAATDIHAMAHVTGGGLTGNLPRVLPEGCRARISRAAWTVPPVFDTLRRAWSSSSRTRSRRRRSRARGPAASPPSGSTRRTSVTAPPTTRPSAGRSTSTASGSSASPASCGSSRADSSARSPAAS